MEAVEAWSLQNADIRLAGTAGVQRRQAGGRLWRAAARRISTGPQMVAGRWLEPGDGNVVVLNQKVADEAGLAIGDTVTLKIGVDNESDWLVVGLLFDPVVTVSAHVPLTALGRAQHRLNRADTIWIQTTNKDSASIREMAQDLRTVYNDEHVRLQAGSVFGKDTSVEIIDGVMVQFAVIFTLLATMAVLIGVVGSLALSGVLSLNVLERRREIGVLRAIGASSAAVGGQFVGEGLILGWLSWLIAWPLSLPAGQLMVSGLSAPWAASSSTSTRPPARLSGWASSPFSPSPPAVCPPAPPPASASAKAWPTNDIWLHYYGRSSSTIQSGNGYFPVCNHMSPP